MLQVDPQDGLALVIDDLIGSLGPDPEAARRQADAEVAGSRKAAMERHLRTYCAQAWNLVSAKPFVPTWHVDAVCDHLQAVKDGHISRLIVLLPPATAKSTVVSVMFPTWLWGPAGRPELHIQAISATSADKDPALRDGGYARDLIETPWYQAYWGDRFQLSEVQNTKAFYRNDRKGYRISSGLAAVSGDRCDLMILDDVVKPLDRLNATALEGFKAAYPSLISRLDTPGWIVAAQQRLNADDPAGYLMEKAAEEGWVVLRLPRLFEPEHRCVTFLPGGDGRPFFADPRRHEGEPLTPDTPPFKPLAQVLQERVRSGEWVFAASEQQRPTPLTGGIIKLHWIRRWARAPIDGQAKLPHTFDRLIQSWDLTFGKKAPVNSWVVGQVWGLHGASAYLLDQRRGHWDMPETMRELVVLSEAWPGCGAKLVEDKANGPAVIQMLGNVVPGLIGVSVEGDKRARMMAVAPFFESGNVWLPEDTYAEWVPEYVSELTRFPSGRALDQGDATSQGVWRLLGGLASSREGDRFAEYNAATPPSPFTAPVAPPVSHGDGRLDGTSDQGVFGGGGGGFDLGALQRAFPTGRR